MFFPKKTGLGGSFVLILHGFAKKRVGGCEWRDILTFNRDMNLCIYCADVYDEGPTYGTGSLKCRNEGDI